MPKSTFGSMTKTIGVPVWMFEEGLEGYFRDSGFDLNTVRESGKR